MDFSLRQKHLRKQLHSARCDALLISHLPNIRYLCGFTGSAGYLLVGPDESVFFTDVRYDTQSRSEVEGARVQIAEKAVLSLFGEWLEARRKQLRKWTIGIEADHLTVAEKKRVKSILPKSMRLRNAASLTERARMIKDKEELRFIREAVQLGATLFESAVGAVKPGVKETDVAAEMEYAARRAGAEEMSFPTIIASGKRSALPHGRATAQPIARGGFVVCDFGVILAGYCSDQTRTLWVGSPTLKAREAYEAVREAQLAAIAAVRPGISASAVDEAARKVLRKAGLGRYFTHSTGHGVGLEIHEAPRVAAGQNDTLQPGTVITIEPGVYFPGKWGIRIEDMVAVTQNGCEVLTPTSKDFLAV